MADTPAAPETLMDKLLSERVLYPAAGFVLMAATIWFVGRSSSNLGPAPTLDLPVITAQGELGAEHVRLTEQRGKVVLFDFWATWCGPCRMMTPVLQRLHTRYASQGLVVVGVNVDESGPAVVPRFRERFGIQYPLVYDVGSTWSTRYGVEGLPTLVLIDRQGNIRYRHAGVESEGELQSLVESLL